MPKLYATFLCFLMLYSLHAQEAARRYLPGEWLTSKQGLSQGMINSIIQDKEGYVWFATKDGLNKYDGYKITVYRHNPDDPYSLPDNYVTTIFEGDNGIFWISTLSHGLYVFDRGTELFFPVNLNVAETISNNVLYAVLFKKGKMLLYKANDLEVYDISDYSIDSNIKNAGKSIKPVFSYNEVQKIKRYKINSSNKPVISWLPNNNILFRLPDTLLLAMPVAGSQNWMLKGYPIQMLGVSKEEFSQVYFDLTPLRLENVFYVLKNKLYQLNLATGTAKMLVRVTSDSTDICLKIQTLPNGTIYIFYRNPLIYDPVSGKLEKILMKREDEDFTGVHTSICEDNTGNVWYGTGGFGVFKSDRMKPPFKAYKINKNFDALSKVYGTSWQYYQQGLKQKIYANFQNTIQDKKGNYWFCNNLEGNFMRPKLICFNPATRGVKKYALLDNNNYLNTIFLRDRQDSLWVFSEEGLNKKMLYRFNSETGVAEVTTAFPIQQNEDSQYPFVSAWLQDANGFFWFATIQGLFRYDPAKNEWKQWKNIPGNVTSLPSDMLFSICPDPNKPLQYLWVGTNGAGFCRFDMLNATCLRFTDKDGLPSNVVYGMLNDSMGNIWMSTNHGLSCFNTAHKMFRNFSKEDNLPGDEFNRAQYVKLISGEMMFGGVDGYVVFNPSAILKARPAVPVVLTGLSISNKPVDWKRDSTIISGPLGYAKKILLHPGQNMFTISFASLDYRSNEKKFYKYRLDGFDKDWTNPSNKNEATYTNLSPGSYLFHVTGTNTDGTWNEKDIRITIIVLPYWYQTTWFKVLIALLAAGGLYGWYRYRLQQHLQVLNLRNRIAGDLHDEIGSTLSSISLSSTIIQNKLNNESADVQALLQQISSHTDTMMEAMSDIVWAINTRNDNFESVVNRMRAFAVEILEPQGVEIHFAIGGAVLHQNLDMVQRKNCYLLFKEAINNAAKYACCKNVWVSITMHTKKIHLEIKDDGKGFVYNKANINERSLGGNGLPGMYKRAAELKGELKIEPAPGLGTVILLCFDV